MDKKREQAIRRKLSLGRCITVGCMSRIRARGLCRNCRRAVDLLIENGQDEDSLIAAGVILPQSRGPKRKTPLLQ